jgi:hypothetical protein
MIQKPQPVTEIVVIHYNLGNCSALHVFPASHDCALQFIEQAKEYGTLTHVPGDTANIRILPWGYEEQYSQYYRLDINPIFDGKEVAIYLGNDGIVYDNTSIIHRSDVETTVP